VLKERNHVVAETALPEFWPILGGWRARRAVRLSGATETEANVEVAYLESKGGPTSECITDIREWSCG